MKSEYKYRKQWEAIARELGMRDYQFHVAATDPVTKKDHMILVNNYRRFVRGMCALPLAEQQAKLLVFKEKMEELKAANNQARKDLEPELQGIVTKPEEVK